MNNPGQVVTIRVEKPIRVSANMTGDSISFDKAIELPAKKTTQKFLMPFQPKNPFMWNPEMDFRSNLVYDLPIWPRAESIHVKLDPSVTEFKNEMRIPTKNIVPVKDDEPTFQSNFPKPPLSYVIPEGQEVELLDELPNTKQFEAKIPTKPVHTLVKEGEDIMTKLSPIPPNTVVSNKDFMDMRLIVQFPGKLPIFQDEKYPPPEGEQPKQEPEPEVIQDKSKAKIGPKRSYTVEEVMSRRPLSTDTIEKLKTPGFIMLMSLSALAQNQNFSTRRTGYNKKAALIEHQEERYIATSYRRKAGDFTDESVEAKMREATIKLNSLNQVSLNETLSWFKSNIGPLLPMHSVIFLLINRSTMEADAPEYNQLTRLYALFAHYLCEDNIFHEKLVSLTLQRYESLVNSVQTKTTIIQSFIVWMGCLLKETIIAPFHYYKAMELAIMKQPLQKAVEIVRTALATAGGYLAGKKYSEVSTFYRFVADHCANCSGYVKFLVRELLENRISAAQTSLQQPAPAPEPETIKQQPQKPKQTTGRRSEKAQSTMVDENYDIAALEEEIEGQYIQTAPNEPFDPILPPSVPLKGVITMAFKLLKKHAKDIHDFADYLGLLISRLPYDHTEIRREVQIQHPLYQQQVIEEDNSSLWRLAFVLYGELFNRKLFSFIEIIEFIRLIPKEGPQPRVERVLESFLQHAYVEENDVIEAYQKTELLKDEMKLAESIAAVRFETGTDAETRARELDKEAKPTIVECGFFCRRLVFDLFGTEDSQMRYKEILKKSQKTFETIVMIYPEFCQTVLEISCSQLEAEQVMVMEFLDYVHAFINGER